MITYFNRPAAQLWGREPGLNDPADRWCGSFRLFWSDGTPMAHEECWMAQTIKANAPFNGHVEPTALIRLLEDVFPDRATTPGGH